VANPTPDSYIVPVGDAVIFTDTTHEGREGFYGQSRKRHSFVARTRIELLYSSSIELSQILIL